MFMHYSINIKKKLEHLRAKLVSQYLALRLTTSVIYH